MKQTTIILLAATIVLLCGCRHDKTPIEPLATLPITTTEGIRYMGLDMTDTIPFSDGTLLGVQNEYHLEWPSLDQFSTDVQHELILLAFGDSTATSLSTAAERFLASSGFDDEDNWYGSERSRRTLDVHPPLPTNSASIHGTCRQDSNLLYFEVSYENTLAAAAHGIYGTRSLLLDLGTDRTVQLTNLLTDTSMLGEVMIRALEDLTVNRDHGNTTECLFDEYRQRLPQPDGFFLDSTRSVLTAYFNPYSAQSYACGMLFVEMPIYWLSKHIPFTPYGTSLLRLRE